MIAHLAACLPLRARAQAVAAELREAGIRVVSSWHGQSTATVEAERRLTRAERLEIRDLCRAEIAQCDVLAPIVGPPVERHGSFREAERAEALGKRVFVLRPYGASVPVDELDVFTAGHEAVETVDGLLRVMCGGPAR